MAFWCGTLEPMPKSTKRKRESEHLDESTVEQSHASDGQIWMAILPADKRFKYRLKGPHPVVIVNSYFIPGTGEVAKHIQYHSDVREEVAPSTTCQLTKPTLFLCDHAVSEIGSSAYVNKMRFGDPMGTVDDNDLNILKQKLNRASNHGFRYFDNAVPFWITCLYLLCRRFHSWNVWNLETSPSYSWMKWSASSFCSCLVSPPNNQEQLEGKVATKRSSSCWSKDKRSFWNLWSCNRTFRCSWTLAMKRCSLPTAMREFPFLGSILCLFVTALGAASSSTILRDILRLDARRSVLTNES